MAHSQNQQQNTKIEENTGGTHENKQKHVSADKPLTMRNFITIHNVIAITL